MSADDDASWFILNSLAVFMLSNEKWMIENGKS